MKGRASATLVFCLGFVAFYSIHYNSLSNNINQVQVSSSPSITLPAMSINSPSITPYTTLPAIICDRTHYHYDTCSLNGPIFMDPTTSTIQVVGPTIPMQKLRPYPRKWETSIMSHIKELTLTTTTTNATPPPCHIRHHAPALVFSNGGYTGNLFHDFNDGLIPLFITTRHLLSGGPDRDLVLVIANCHKWWLTKYAELLRGFTRHPIVNLDVETSIHCFPSATVGLISHGFVSIHPSLMPNSESIVDFRAFLDRSYAKSGLRPAPSSTTARPRLVLAARNGTVGRVIMNQADIVRAAEAAGFEVTMFTPSQFTSLREAYRLINASHVLVGVHGAALTHSYFLRPGAVLIQVVPLGLQPVSELCFGGPARQVGLEYMEYKITVEESSLLEKYDRDDMVLKNPNDVVKKGWSYTNIYLKSQDVRLDLVRVTMYLEKAYVMARRLMKMEGQS